MQLRVLVVEDSEDDAVLMLRELERAGYEVSSRVVNTEEAMELALRDAQWDVVLADYSMPEFDGLSALKVARRLAFDVPFILVSGSMGEDVAVKAMRAGAHDYILKGSLARLAPAVKRELGEAEVRRQHREAERARQESESKYASIFRAALDGILLVDAETGHVLESNAAIGKMLGYAQHELRQLAIPDLHPKDALASILEILERQKAGKESLAVDIPMRRKDGSVLYVDINSAQIEVGEQQCVLGIVRDITQRRESERRIRRLLEQQTHINELSLELGNVAEIDRIYGSVFRHIGTLMDAESFIVSFHDPMRQAVVAAYAVFNGQPFDVSELPPIPLEDAGLGTQSEVIRTGRAIYLPDLRKARQNGRAEYAVDDSGAVTAGSPAKGAQTTRSALLAPLKIEGETIGVMQVQSHRLDAYTQDDMDLLSGLASVAAVAISNSRLVQEIRDSLDSTIEVAARTVEIRDPYTSGHQRRVTELACAIARDLGLSSDKIEGLRVAGLLHDIGKMAIPAEVLSKPTQLSAIEYSLIQAHPQVGHDLLAGVRFARPVAKFVLQHHERMNGSGYPQGLERSQILMEARILAAADVVEAMSSHRPYRPALGIEAAEAELRSGRGELYDSEVVDACLHVLDGGFRFTPSEE
jgi:PAS domain S-box-containing protein/putative nucleotidyltransferase with HDIG domain